MTHDQLIERLRWMRDAKSGMRVPEWLKNNPDWASVFTEMAAKALEVIEKPPHHLACGCCVCGEILCDEHDADRAATEKLHRSLDKYVNEKMRDEFLRRCNDGE